MKLWFHSCMKPQHTRIHHTFVYSLLQSHSCYRDTAALVFSWSWSSSMGVRLLASSFIGLTLMRLLHQCVFLVRKALLKVKVPWRLYAKVREKHQVTWHWQSEQVCVAWDCCSSAHVPTVAQHLQHSAKLWLFLGKFWGTNSHRKPGQCSDIIFMVLNFMIRRPRHMGKWMTSHDVTWTLTCAW